MERMNSADEVRHYRVTCRDAGRVVGVRAKQSDGQKCFRASRGVVLAAGAFGMNREMVNQHSPQFPDTTEPLGIPNNDGDAIRLGQAAGGGLRSMDGIIATASFYPPEQLIKAILVNSHGERFVAEDSYHGRTAQAIMEQPGTVAYLLMDAAIFAYPEVGHANHRLIDGWETVEEMEKGLPEPFARFALEWVHGANLGEWGELTGDLERLIGHKPMTTSEFLHDNYPTPVASIENAKAARTA